MRRRRGDKGQAGIQYIGMLPILLIVVLLCFKIYLTMDAFEHVEDAARTGAREASINHDLGACQSSALNALPSWLKQPEPDDKYLTNGSGTRAWAIGSGSPIGTISCRVQARIPVLWQAVPFDFTVDRTVRMPG